MSSAAPQTMTLAEFYAWADRQPKGRYELIDGEVYTMAPERLTHVDAKALAWLALRTAIRAADLPCQAIADGIAVEVGHGTTYQPDALVNCGPRMTGDMRMAPAPIVIVEVTSPSTERNDTIWKFRDYFRLPTVRHYLIVDADKRLLLHHRKDAAGLIQSAILGGGPLSLDPPGITIQVEDLFAPD